MSTTIQHLKSSAEKYAEGVLTRTLVPRLDILRVTEPTKLFPEIYRPLISLILQGKKQLLIGSEVVEYGVGQTFISSVELPVIGEVLKASPADPYLALRLTFDRSPIADLLRDTDSIIKPTETPCFAIDKAGNRLLDAWVRLLDLTEHPDEIPVMAPLLEREILFRLLHGSQGAVLRQVACMDSRFAPIREALIWIRKNFATAFRVEELAAGVNMSPSAFHRRFKATTAMSPLQYQKQIKMYEARRMLFLKPGDVAAVALAVGYESLSQFTREYSRMFGSPPARDIRGLRGGTLGISSLL